MRYTNETALAENTDHTFSLIQSVREGNVTQRKPGGNQAPAPPTQRRVPGQRIDDWRTLSADDDAEDAAEVVGRQMEDEGVAAEEEDDDEDEEEEDEDEMEENQEQPPTEPAPSRPMARAAARFSNVFRQRQRIEEEEGEEEDNDDDDFEPDPFFYRRPPPPPPPKQSRRGKSGRTTATTIVRQNSDGVTAGTDVLRTSVAAKAAFKPPKVTAPVKRSESDAVPSTRAKSSPAKSSPAKTRTAVAVQVGAQRRVLADNFGDDEDFELGAAAAARLASGSSSPTKGGSTGRRSTTGDKPTGDKPTAKSRKAGGAKKAKLLPGQATMDRFFGSKSVSM